MSRTKAGSPNPLLKIGEVASLFKVTPAAVRDWEKAGHLTPFRTPGGQRRYRRSEIEALLPHEYLAALDAEVEPDAKAAM